MSRLSITLLLVATGAFSVPTAAAAQTETTQAEATPKVAPVIAAPPAGMGQVVFYRPSAMGALVSCRVNEAEKVVNRLHPGHYFVETATPGIHEYSVHSEAKDVLRVNVEEGETQYARCNITMGFMVGRPNLSTQDRADFDKRGKKLKLEAPLDPAAKDEAKQDTKAAEKN